MKQINKTFLCLVTTDAIELSTILSYEHIIQTYT